MNDLGYIIIKINGEDHFFKLIQLGISYLLCTTLPPNLIHI